MKKVAQLIWTEPAVFIGLLGSIAIFLVELAADTPWTVATVIAVFGPFLSSLGIRQAVTPAAGPREEPPSAVDDLEAPVP